MDSCDGKQEFSSTTFTVGWYPQCNVVAGNNIFFVYGSFSRVQYLRENLIKVTIYKRRT